MRKGLCSSCSADASVQAWGRAVLAAAAASLVFLLAIPAPASADWNGEATLDSGPLRVDFMERFEVTVTNDGPEALEVLSVALTVVWGPPTYYEVFEGSAVLAPGESRSFASEPVRMPTTDPGSYPAYIKVMAREDGGAVAEKQFSGSLDLYVFGISAAGVPEEVFVPLTVTGAMLLLTLLLFRFERSPGWPPFRSVPRWRRRS